MITTTTHRKQLNNYKLAVFWRTGANVTPVWRKSIFRRCSEATWTRFRTRNRRQIRQKTEKYFFKTQTNVTTAASFDDNWMLERDLTWCLSVPSLALSAETLSHPYTNNKDRSCPLFPHITHFSNEHAHTATRALLRSFSVYLSHTHSP